MQSTPSPAGQIVCGVEGQSTARRAPGRKYSLPFPVDNHSPLTLTRKSRFPKKMNFEQIFWQNSLLRKIKHFFRKFFGKNIHSVKLSSATLQQLFMIWKRTKSIIVCISTSNHYSEILYPMFSQPHTHIATTKSFQSNCGGKNFPSSPVHLTVIHLSEHACIRPLCSSI